MFFGLNIEIVIDAKGIEIRSGRRSQPFSYTDAFKSVLSLVFDNRPVKEELAILTSVYERCSREGPPIHWRGGADTLCIGSKLRTPRAVRGNGDNRYHIHHRRDAAAGQYAALTNHRSGAFAHRRPRLPARPTLAGHAKLLAGWRIKYSRAGAGTLETTVAEIGEGSYEAGVPELAPSDTIGARWQGSGKRD
jgi:hypothetical protein